MEILLNPGPVNLSKRVRRALLKPDLCHREIEFSELQNSILGKLLDVYNLDSNQWAAILLTGSGTAAMEAMMISLIPDNGKILIIENGVYGERLSRIAEIHDISYNSLHYEWGEEVDIGKLQQSLTDDITHVAVVHHETTTGRLNDIAAIADVCKSRNISLLLDGVSSFGAEEICFQEWNIAACAATANKCLHGIPGASFVVTNRNAVKQAGNIQRTLYLDLHTYLRQQDKGGTPFTQSVQSFYALDEALDEHHDEGGWRNRQAVYRTRMESVKTALHEIGIESLLPEKISSCVLHAFRLPEGIDYTALHDRLKEYGFIIYAGQGEFATRIFRISLMGAIGDDDLKRLLDAFRQIVQ